MAFYDILCVRLLLNYMAMPRAVEILTSAAVLGKASNSLYSRLQIIQVGSM